MSQLGLLTGHRELARRSSSDGGQKLLSEGSWLLRGRESKKGYSFSGTLSKFTSQINHLYRTGEEREQNQPRVRLSSSLERNIRTEEEALPIYGRLVWGLVFNF